MSDNTRKEIMESVGNSASVVFSMDTTGSMQPCIEDVRRKLRGLVEEMFATIPNLRIGLIAHGDYCDGEDCLKVLDLTTNIGDLMEFINRAPNTSGGDAPECYELALNAATMMNWGDDGGTLVLIGDDEPHPPHYSENVNHIDWREELKVLADKNVRVVPLQCLRNQKVQGKADAFWEEVAQKAETPLLFLDSFAEAAYTLGGIAAATSGTASLNYYVSNRLATGVTTPEMLDNFTKISSYAAKRDEMKEPTNA